MIFDSGSVPRRAIFSSREDLTRGLTKGSSTAARLPSDSRYGRPTNPESINPRKSSNNAKRSNFSTSIVYFGIIFKVFWEVDRCDNRFRAKRDQVKRVSGFCYLKAKAKIWQRFSGLLPESQGQNQAWTVRYVPYSLFLITCWRDRAEIARRKVGRRARKPIEAVLPN